MSISLSNGALEAEPLQQRVEEWLSGEGYPLEFLCASIFTKHGLWVHQGLHVRDEKAQALREIDVTASKQRSVGEQLLRITHVVECMSSQDEPWVVLTSRNGSISASACVAQTVASELGHALLRSVAGDANLHATDAFLTPSRPGFGGRQAFTKERDFFFSTLQSVVSGAFSVATKYDPKSLDSPTLPTCAEVVFPVVVVDAALFEAHFDTQTHKMVVEPSKRVRVHWKGCDRWPHYASVDIVTIDGLDEFVRQRAQEMSLILDRMSDALARTKDCVSKGSFDDWILSKGSTGLSGPPPLIWRIMRTIQDKSPIKGSKEVLSSEVILARLSDAPAADEDTARRIVDAELIPFDEEQANKLRPILLTFIARYRDSADPADLVAVASAIRKYIAILNNSDLGSISTLLEAGHRAPVPLEIELEIAKMIVRKLTANPPSQADPFPELGDRLIEICRTYLTDRLLPRRNYGATALDSSLALAMLGSRHVPELIKTLQRLKVSWFKQQLGRRAQLLRTELGSQANEHVLQRLDDLNASLK